MDSPEGERATEVLDTLLDLMDDVQVDVKHRQFVWPDTGRLNLQQCIEHIQKQCPEFHVEEIEGHLLYWIEGGYNPENHSLEPLARSNWMSLKGPAFNGSLITRDGWLRDSEPRENSSLSIYCLKIILSQIRSQWRGRTLTY